MNKVNLEEALTFVEITNIDSTRVTKLTYHQACLWLSGMVLSMILKGQGNQKDKWYDGTLVKHFAQSMENLEYLKHQENLKDNDLVSIEYDVETDTWLFS